MDIKTQESINEVIKNSKFGKEEWNKIESEDVKKKFKKYFHLRPTQSGFTIVSTHPNRPMNGIQAVSKLNLKVGIENIEKAINNENIEWKKANIILLRNHNKTRGFHITQKRPNKEYKVQANFINKLLEGSKEIKDIFGVKELDFIGSEIILPGKKEKIDILAYGETSSGSKKIFFIEVKKAGKVSRDLKEKAFEQVQEYVDVYSKDKDFATLIANYPMLDREIDINECECEGWVVKGNTNEEKMIKKDANYIEIFQESVK
jgi:hypothetical protein